MENIIRLFRQTILKEDHSQESGIPLAASKKISSKAYEKGEVLGEFVTDIIEVGDNDVEIVIKDGVDLEKLNDAIRDFQLSFKSHHLQYVFHYIDKNGTKVISDPFTKWKYTRQLAKNLKEALPLAEINLSGQYIIIKKVDPIEPDLKEWFDSFLVSLPEIDYPIETVRFFVHAENGRTITRVINPSEFDLKAVEYAIESGLKFSQPEIPAHLSSEPLPLDHPVYSNPNYFKK